MTIGELIGLAIKAFVLANLVMLVFALMTWIERRVIGFFQYRLGPNRVGPFGLLQPIADLLKLIRKENFAPNSVNQVLHIAAPMLTLFFALSAFAVVPFGDGTVSIFGWETTPHMAADNSVAVLFAVAMSGLGGYGVIVGGWASNSKYALLGALRACAQLISYEVSLALSVLPVVMMAASLSMVDIANASYASDWAIGGWNPWFIVWVPIGFVIFVIAALAESNRAPFDFAEAEQELVAGFHTEFGGLRYALFANAEYIHMLTINALGVTFFLGGWHGPLLEEGWWIFGASWLWGILWFLLKMSVMLFIFIWIRATIPRLRYDRLMRLGWKAMLPAATLQFVLTAIAVANRGDEDVLVAVLITEWAVVGAFLAWVMLRRRARANDLHPAAAAMLEGSR